MSEFTHKNLSFDESLFTIGIKADGDKYKWACYDGETAVEKGEFIAGSQREAIVLAANSAYDAWVSHVIGMREE